MGALIELPPSVKCFRKTRGSPCRGCVGKCIAIRGPWRSRRREFRFHPFEDASHRGGARVGQAGSANVVCDVLLNRKIRVLQIEDVRDVSLKLLADSASQTA